MKTFDRSMVEECQRKARDVNVEDALVQTGVALQVALQFLHRRVQKTRFRA